MLWVTCINIAPADIAAAVLLQDGHAGKAYELTGPEAITRAEPVRLIGEALGRDIPFAELTHEQAVGQLRPVMGEYAAWYFDRMAHLVEHPQRALPTVEEITGRPGTTFAEWAIQHADIFRRPARKQTTRVACSPARLRA